MCSVQSGNSSPATCNEGGGPVETITVTKEFNQDGTLTTKTETVNPDGSKFIKIATKNMQKCEFLHNHTLSIINDIDNMTYLCL